MDGVGEARRRAGQVRREGAGFERVEPPGFHILGDVARRALRALSVPKRTVEHCWPCAWLLVVIDRRHASVHAHAQHARQRAQRGARHAIARAAGGVAGYSADDVAKAAGDKLIRRHPHVFGDQKANSAEIAFETWEKEKQREKAQSGQDRSVLSGVPVALPALLRAYRIGQKAAKAGFDWPDRAGPSDKLREELLELEEAIASGDQEDIHDELGDVLFSVCNLARHLGINPEVALAANNDKFQRRFQSVERAFDYQLEGRSLTEMEGAWDAAKREGL